MTASPCRLYLITPPAFAQFFADLAADAEAIYSYEGTQEINTLVAGLAYSVVNLLVDLAYAAFDPRISFS